MSTVAAGSRSTALAFSLASLLGEVAVLAERLEDAAFEDAEPGLAYAARIVRRHAEEDKEMLEKILSLHAGSGE